MRDLDKKKKLLEPNKHFRLIEIVVMFGDFESWLLGHGFENRDFGYKELSLESRNLLIFKNKQDSMIMLVSFPFLLVLLCSEIYDFYVLA